MPLPREWFPPRERLVIPASKRSNGLILLGCIAGAVLCPVALSGGWVESTPVHRNAMWLVIGTVFFGVGAIWAALQLLPGASYLALSKEGLEFRSTFRSKLIPWNQVSDFRWGVITGVGSFPYLGFDLKDRQYYGGYVSAAIRPDLVQNANALIAWKAFARSAEDLGTLLAAWRQHHAA